MMDCKKVGRLIYDLRREKGMTQKNLADAMNISDRTVSKWERGIGCPDVSLLKALADVLNVNIEKILSGDSESGDGKGGNMKRIKFYLCPVCGNVLCAAGEAEIFCCGRKLAPLVVREEDEAHGIRVEEIENEYYVTSDHAMSKEHYIAFAACVSFDSVTLVKLYPEQMAEVRLPRLRRGDIYVCCNNHGLYKHSGK